MINKAFHTIISVMNLIFIIATFCQNKFSKGILKCKISFLSTPIFFLNGQIQMWVIGLRKLCCICFASRKACLSIFEILTFLWAQTQITNTYGKCTSQPPSKLYFLNALIDCNWLVIVMSVGLFFTEIFSDFLTISKEKNKL